MTCRTNVDLSPKQTGDVVSVLSHVQRGPTQGETLWEVKEPVSRAYIII
jgi:hypothetical protein